MFWKVCFSAIMGNMTLGIMKYIQKVFKQGFLVGVSQNVDYNVAKVVSSCKKVPKVVK